MSARIISAVPVPFTADGSLDLATYDAAIAAIAPHVGGALVAGTMGEFPALDDDERVELFRRAADLMGTERVIAHLGHGSSRQVLRLAGAVAAIGIRRFALLSPYYLPTDDDGVVQFFRALTEAHPQAEVYAYLFPERTGMDVSPATLGRVLALPGMVGVKLSGVAAARLPEYAAVLGPDHELYSGDVSSAFPETFAALARALDAGSSEAPQSTDLQAVVEEIVPLAGSTITRLKAAMSARDGAPWASRMSLPAVDDATRKAIRAAVETHR
jgi:4-hydroxy-tetrahydrodipicolinate synthase